MSVFGDVKAHTTAYALVHEQHVPLRLVQCRMGMRTAPPAAYYDPQATTSTPASQGFRRHLLSTAHGMPLALSSRDFPPWQTIYYHFRRLRLSGVWHSILIALRTAERQRMGRHPQPTAAIMDAQSVKTVEESAS